jgi:hypothetical protein
MRQTVWLGVMVLMCVAADPKPAEPKAAMLPELSTPKMAAITFVRAMEADDTEAFRKVTLGNEEDYQLFEPLLRMTGAAKNLEKAARTRFGKEGTKIVRESPAVGLEVHVQESDVKVNGDRATLKHKADGDADALPLKMTPAGWKVDLTAISNRTQMSAAAGGMLKMQQTLDQAASDILEGKFKTPDEAAKAVVARMTDAARQR